MRLVLSSHAAPDASLGELLAACGRRGFAALELVDGDAHGVHCESCAFDARAVTAVAAGAGVPVAAFLVPGERASPAALQALARLGAALDAPVVVPADGADAPALLAQAAPHFAAAGSTILLATGGGVAEMDRLRRLVEDAPPGSAGLAWDVDPGRGSHDGARPVQRERTVGKRPPAAREHASQAPEAVLETGGGRIRHVRLHGGGPEAVSQTGLGIGRLMRALALSGYTGTLAVTPGTPRFHYAWGAWLGRRGGWGCGSKAHDGAGVMTLSTKGGRGP